MTAIVIPIESEALRFSTGDTLLFLSFQLGHLLTKNHQNLETEVRKKV